VKTIEEEILSEIKRFWQENKDVEDAIKLVAALVATSKVAKNRGIEKRFDQAAKSWIQFAKAAQ